MTDVTIHEWSVREVTESVGRRYLPLCGDAEDVIHVAVAEHRGDETPINRHSIRNIDVLVVHNRVCRLVISGIDDGVLFQGEGDSLREEGRDSDPLWLQRSIQLVELGRRNRARDLRFRIKDLGSSAEKLFRRSDGRKREEFLRFGRRGVSRSYLEGGRLHGRLHVLGNSRLHPAQLHRTWGSSFGVLGCTIASRSAPNGPVPSVQCPVSSVQCPVPATFENFTSTKVWAFLLNGPGHASPGIASGVGYHHRACPGPPS